MINIIITSDHVRGTQREEITPGELGKFQKN